MKTFMRLCKQASINNVAFDSTNNRYYLEVIDSLSK